MELRAEVERYAKKNGYPIADFRDLECACGSKQFNLHSDDTEGGAVALCVNCGIEIDIEDSKKYIEESYHNICNCDNPNLAIGIGKACFSESSDPRWIYVGAHCSECHLAGVYVDWKVQ